MLAKSKLLVLVWLVAAVCLLGLSLPSPAASKDQLTVATEAETSSMDPMKAWVTYGLAISRLMYDTPIEFAPNGELTPGLATKWEPVNNVTWRFHLRKDAKFHNGYPVTAADVKFTIQRIQDPKNKCRFRSRYAHIAEVKIVDDYTFDIITKQPDPLLPNRVAFFIKVVSKRWVEENGPEALHKKAMGTGPFKFVSWAMKDRLILEANTDHYLYKPKVKRVIIRPVPEMAARMAELQAGGVQIATNVPPFMIPQLSKDPRLQVQKVPAPRTMFMTINTRDVPELKNKLVRQALNYAVDKEAIIKGVMRGLGGAVGLPAPPLVPGIDKSIKPYPYDPGKAKALLKKAGYAKGFNLNLYCPSGRYPMDKEMAQAVAEQLRAVGIKVKLQVMETQNYFRKLIKHELKGLMLVGFGYAYADQDSMAILLLSKGAYSYFNNSAIDELVPKMRSAMDRKARYKLAHRIQKIVHEECPMVFLFNLVNVYGVSKQVQGFQVRSDDYLDLHKVSLK